MGPDLSKVYSSEGKGIPLIHAMLKSGSQSMPAFSLNDSELSKLVMYLRSVDQSGAADPRKFNIHINGMISEHEGQ